MALSAGLGASFVASLSVCQARHPLPPLPAGASWAAMFMKLPALSAQTAGEGCTKETSSVRGEVGKALVY